MTRIIESYFVEVVTDSESGACVTSFVGDVSAPEAARLALAATPRGIVAYVFRIRFGVPIGPPVYEGVPQ